MAPDRQREIVQKAKKLAQKMGQGVSKYKETEMYSLDGLRCELVLVTPAMAAHLCESCHYERQRPIADHHVDFLVSEIKAGRFLRGTPIHFGMLGAPMFLMNGNHTMKAIAKSGISVPLLFLYEEAKSEEELGRIYARHDRHRMRDWRAILMATGQYEKIDFPKVWVNAACTAMPLVMNDLVEPKVRSDPKGLRKSGDVRVDALEDFKDEIAMYAMSCEGAKGSSLRMLRRATVMACGLIGFRYQPSMAEEFISAIARDENLKTRDARKKLLEWTRSNPSTVRTKEDQVGRFISAWNAHFEGRTLDKLYAAPPGTPMKGTQIGLVSGNGAMPPKPNGSGSRTLKTGMMTTKDGEIRPVTTA